MSRVCTGILALGWVFIAVGAVVVASAIGWLASGVRSDGRFASA